jgi:hypothetical protein
MVQALPSSVAVGALYERLLQSALRRFLARAQVCTQALESPSADGLLDIVPTDDAGVLTVTWLGSRHELRAPADRPFSRHEVGLATAIGAVLRARYRAVFDPRLMVERADLFQGEIDDRYVAALLAGDQADAAGVWRRTELIAVAIDVLRVAALSSYENRPISTGVLLLDADADPCVLRRVPETAVEYSPLLTGVKAFYRLCDGLRTVMLVNRRGRLIDVVDIARWARDSSGGGALEVPCSAQFRGHALSTAGNHHVCAVLSPTHEIKVFAGGVQVFSFRSAGWHLLDLEAKYRMWVKAVGNAHVAERLFQSALDLADAREGALFVVLRQPLKAMGELLSPGEIIMDNPARLAEAGLSRRDFVYLLSSRNVVTLDPSVLAGFAAMDGATVCDRDGRLIAVGAILRHPASPTGPRTVTEGARSTAAIAASRFGPVLKVSEDGTIAAFDREKLWDL